MQTITLVDLRKPGYGFHLQFRSEYELRHKAFVLSYRNAMEKYGVKVWEKDYAGISSIEFVTENQDVILNASMDIAAAMGLHLNLQ